MFNMSKFILSAFADEIDQDLKTQMDVLDQHGIKHIEMRGVNGKTLVDYDLDEVREIKRQLDERGFKLSAVGSPIGKIQITDEFVPHLDKFKHTLEVAKIMEAPYIRMFSFYIPRDDDRAQHRDEVIRRWEAFIEAAEDYDVILLHENETGIYGDTPENCHDLLTALNSDKVKGIFDFANFVQCNAKNYPDAFELLKDQIVYIHIKDAVYDGHHVVPAGQGDGNVQEILQELYEDGFEGFLSLEPHLWNFDGFDTLEEDSPGFLLDEGGAKSFAIAVQALKKILAEIEK